jgi:hypothetical protein
MRLALLSGLLAIFLASSVGIKAAVNMAADMEGGNEPSIADVEPVLRAQGFAVVQDASGGVPRWIVAVRNGCALKAAEISPLGWHDAVVEQHAREGDRIVYLYRGRIYAERPALKAMADQIVWRLGRYLASGAAAQPVLAVVLPKACIREIPDDGPLFSALLARIAAPPRAED